MTKTLGVIIEEKVSSKGMQR